MDTNLFIMYRYLKEYSPKIKWDVSDIQMHSDKEH